MCSQIGPQAEFVLPGRAAADLCRAATRQPAPLGEERSKGFRRGPAVYPLDRYSGSRLTTMYDRNNLNVFRRLARSSYFSVQNLAHGRRAFLQSRRPARKTAERKAYAARRWPPFPHEAPLVIRDFHAFLPPSERMKR